MTGLSLALLLIAAFGHATWNLIAKRSNGQAPFVWLTALCSTALLAPPAIAVLLWQKPVLGTREFLFMFGTGLLHLAYFLTLQTGYRVGDLSLVYPLARGTGPLLATFGAIVLFGERPSPVALMGAIVIPLSAFILTGGPAALRTSGVNLAVRYGVGTGMIIASYTLWDKHAVSALLIPPLLLDFAGNAVRCAMMTPYILPRWQEVQAEWKRHRKEAMAVATLSSLSYILVLTALSFTAVSYVAPAREMSILIGTLMGSRLLAEGDASRRLMGAAGIVAGVIALAVG